MSILLQQLTKRYDGHPVVNDVSLEIADGEFFVLLGSSGGGRLQKQPLYLVRCDGGVLAQSPARARVVVLELEQVRGALNVRWRLDGRVLEPIVPIHGRRREPAY